MERTRVCKQCGAPFIGSGPYCPAHSQRFGGFRRTPVNPVYRDSRWRRLAAAVISEWVAAHGWTCPGWHRPAHPSRQLTADHRQPLARGGAPFDRSNLAVLCRTCNTAKGKR